MPKYAHYFKTKRELLSNSEHRQIWFTTKERKNHTLRVKTDLSQEDPINKPIIKNL
jgi:hypothetical protein